MRIDRRREKGKEEEAKEGTEKMFVKTTRTKKNTGSSL
jgi:hypothetical protein